MRMAILARTAHIENEVLHAQPEKILYANFADSHFAAER
jgi:hypothetical protein